MEEGRLINGAFLQALRERKRKWQRFYTMVPREWETRLLEAKRIATYRLAHELLYRHWQSGGGPIIVTGKVAKVLKLDRQAKAQALAELERLDLIEVERSSRKAPQAKLRHMPKR